ncbi:MAG TPA: hypothetical protein VGD50_05850 [Candidatus Baltobacteraceae bacterium]
MAALRAGALALVLTSMQAPLAPAAAGTGQPVDGISCDANEGALFHIHQHLALYVSGATQTVPGQIGIPPYGNCIYWLHTHQPDGIIHIEAPVYRSFSLGNFFDIWGQALGPTTLGMIHTKPGQMRVYLNGHRFAGNPRAIQLSLHADIVIEVKPPFFVPKPFTNWQGQ